MNNTVGIVGSGYVGLVTGACLAHFGTRVVFNDVDHGLLKELERGVLRIHEQGLPELIREGLDRGLISTEYDKSRLVQACDLLFLCLPTPPKADGNADLRFIREVTQEIARLMRTPKVIVNKSTAPVGTARLIREIVRHYYQGEFFVVSMPEFLQEGKAVATSLHADRYVVGFERETPAAVRDTILNLLRPFGCPLVATDNKTAELVKYVCNAFLSLEISYINSLTGICEKLGIDITDISRIMRLDSRIGPKAFLEAGPGYGGMCFPKDVLSMIGISDRFGYTNKLLQTVDEINTRQQLLVAEKALACVAEIPHPRIAILGLSFKKNTSDVRKSQSKAVIETLLERGVQEIVAYDPLAMENFQTYDLPIKYAPSAQDALRHAHCAVIMTEWDEFKDLPLPEVKGLMATPCLVDTRNLLDPAQARQLGFTYRGMGRP